MSNKLKTYTDESLKQYQPRIDAEKQIINTAADSNLKIVEDDYNAQIAETEQSYNELFDQNNVQRIINERTIAENMANMGLTDSGLNRTQMTANQLSFANNQSKISLGQQRAIDTLARSMLASTTEIKNKKMTDLAGIDSKYYNLAVGDATNRINTETEQAAAIEKARIESLAKLNQQKQDDYNKVMEVLGNKNYNDAYKQLYIDNFKTKYNLTDTEGQKLFGSPGTKYTYSDDELEGNAISGDVSLGDDDIINILKKYHKADNDKGFLYDLIEAHNIDPASTQGIKLKNEIEKQTEGTRLFWTNPHIDGPIGSYYVKGEKLGNASDGIYYESTIKDIIHGNVWTLSQVYDASSRALAREKAAKEKAKKEGKIWNALSDSEKQQRMDEVTEDTWKGYVDDSDIIKEAKRQTKKVQAEAFN